MYWYGGMRSTDAEIIKPGSQPAFRTPLPLFPPALQMYWSGGVRSTDAEITEPSRQPVSHAPLSLFPHCPADVLVWWRSVDGRPDYRARQPASEPQVCCRLLLPVNQGAAGAA